MRLIIVIVLLLASAYGQSLEQSNCRAWHDADAIRENLRIAGPPSNLISVMPYRYWNLESTLQARYQTGQQLLTLSNGTVSASGNTDDVGIAWIVPEIAFRTGWPLALALDVFLLGALIIGMTSSLIAFFLMAENRIAFGIAVVAILVCGGLSFKVGDVYMVQASAALATVPWIIYLWQKKSAYRHWLLSALLIGFLLGVSQLIRSHSATGIALLMVPLIWSAQNLRRLNKAAVVLVLAASFLFPQFLFKQAVSERDQYLFAAHPSYKSVPAKHPFWHSAYLGFSFLKNDEVPKYLDEIAITAVCARNVNAAYMSDDYEGVLRERTLTLMKNKPVFAMKTLVGKMAVVILVVLISINLGLISAWRYPKDRSLDIGFAMAIAFNSLFSIIVVPDPRYLLGLVTMCVLYGIVSLQHAVKVRLQERSLL
jgi:hypothetical protein